MTTPSNLSDWALTAMISCAVVASGLAAVRILRGPTSADRGVALDIFLATAVAMCVGSALATREPAFLDIGLVIALVGFVGTLGWARMLDAAKPVNRRGYERPSNTERIE